MKAKGSSLLALAMVAILPIGCKPQTPEASPAPSPSETVRAEGSSLEQVAKSAPAVLYFVKTNCGSNPRAIPLVQRIYAANADGGKFFVVMNADEATAAEWAKSNGTTFPIIPDPEKKIIGKYGVEASQTGILVDKDLKETQRFAGYGREVLEGLNASLGTAKVDLADAPGSGFG